MNEKQQRNDDLQERLIELAVRVLDVVESLPNSIPSFPSSLLARYSIFHLVADDRPRWAIRGCHHPHRVMVLGSEDSVSPQGWPGSTGTQTQLGSAGDHH